MRRKSKLIGWLIAGIVLLLGPVWGMVGTFVGMLLAYCKMEGTQASAEGLAGEMSLALYSTLLGWIAFPIGLVIVVIAAVMLALASAEPDEGGN
jgi:biopolymer transport protein ExbB/TolQ